MKAHEDQHRREVPFVEGDLVWLSSRNFKWRYGTRKFSPKWLGPFKITAAINEVAFKLLLPEEWKIHNVFHASLLKPFVPGTRYKAPGPCDFDEDGTPLWEVETILTHKTHKNGKRSYLVAWKDFGNEYVSWRNESDLKDCSELLREYNSRPDSHLELGQVSDTCEDMVEEQFD